MGISRETLRPMAQTDIDVPAWNLTVLLRGTRGARLFNQEVPDKDDSNIWRDLPELTFEEKSAGAGFIAVRKQLALVHPNGAAELEPWLLDEQEFDMGSSPHGINYLLLRPSMEAGAAYGGYSPAAGLPAEQQLGIDDWFYNQQKLYGTVTVFPPGVPHPNGIRIDMPLSSGEVGDWQIGVEHEPPLS